MPPRVKNFHLSIRLFICPLFLYQTAEHDISKMNVPISMQIGTSDPRGKDMKRPTLGV